ncbi:lipoprotein peptidase LpqM [Segniliparus rotundus DSM 44985]|uniref:Lipoprotein peptidase LpqM n=1 Tax=Segniliparus rotundus (strain ATCC BAA-972 / CDC 1076 / CIP 108378 / DSM 44985 / JCM 13578) TaxID=640132 RepID=D6Z8K8_SEGRD|nr:neutral zinc metallopeptidase [Segniliparus rotundus]ADG98288.1 lipoprotein peptidase LpqM [Segniliparus rotundus DSM 44985]
MTASCVEVVSGKPSRTPPSYRDVVPGLPAAAGPNGLKAGVPVQARPLRGTQGEDETGRKTDQLAMAALEDIEAFWKEKLPKYFTRAAPFQPVGTLYSYDSRDRDAMACGHTTYNEPNAMYCPREDAIAWDRGLLMPLLDNEFPPIAIVAVFAHEYGHRIQHLAKTADETDPTIVLEQQADCFAGFFIHHVVQGRAKHFQLNSSNGLNTILAAMLALRDTPKAATEDDYEENEHGSGFDRVSAFRMGFAEGADACAKIDKKEIDKRRKGLPIVPDPRLGQDNVPIDRSHIEHYVIASINNFYKDMLPTPPKVTYGGIDKTCPNQKLDPDPHKAPPALYCEATDTVSLDIPALAKIGVPTQEGGVPLQITGDTAAFSIIASRFALAYLKHIGQPRSGLGAGLVGACLAGAWLRSIVGVPGVDVQNKPIILTPGDLDKPTSELLQHGYIAQDVNNQAAPSALTRFNAFRVGVVGPKEVCVKQYPPLA